MILSNAGLIATLDQLTLATSALAATRRAVPNAKNYDILAEGPIDAILALRREIDDYLGLPPGPAPDGQPPAPTNLRAIHVFPRAIELAWDEPPIGPGTNYWVVVSWDGGANWTTAGRPEVPTIRVADLEPGRRYQFKVRGRNLEAGGDTGISTRLEVATPADAPGPAAPPPPAVPQHTPDLTPAG